MKTFQIKTLSDLRIAIDAVVAYNWDDEDRDYQENPCASHIFLTLKALDRWARESA